MTLKSIIIISLLSLLACFIFIGCAFILILAAQDNHKTINNHKNSIILLKRLPESAENLTAQSSFRHVLNNAQCGLPIELQSRSLPRFGRIIAGYDAHLNDYPWMVSLRSLKDQLLYDHFCAGVLITEHQVLTAAHCVMNMRAEDIIAVVGLLNRTDVSDLALNSSFKVSKIVINKTNTSESDLAVLILSKPVRNVAICLPEASAALDYIGKEALVAGWGLKQDSTASIVLQQTKLNVLSSRDGRCSSYLNKLTESSLYCAIGVRASGICIGDSGGPLFSRSSQGRWVLIGVVSYVTGYVSSDKSKYTCDPGLPSFYSSVPYHLSWIKSLV